MSAARTAQDHHASGQKSSIHHGAPSTQKLSARRRARAIGAALAAAGLILTSGCSGDVSLPFTARAVAEDLDLADAILGAADGPGYSNAKNALRNLDKNRKQTGDLLGDVSADEIMRNTLANMVTEPAQCAEANAFEDPEYTNRYETEGSTWILKDPSIEIVSYRVPATTSTEGDDAAATTAMPAGTLSDSESLISDLTRPISSVHVRLAKKNILTKAEWYRRCPHSTMRTQTGDFSTEVSANRKIKEFDLPGTDRGLATKTTMRSKSSTEAFGDIPVEVSHEHKVEAQIGPYYLSVSAQGPNAAKLADEYAKKQVDKLYEISE